MRHLEKQLDHFKSRLPAADTFTEENLELRTYSRSLPRYVMIHMFWHWNYCELFQCLIPGLKESISSDQFAVVNHDLVAQIQDKCFQHALSISEICRLVLGLDCSELILDIEMAECAYHAAHLLFHCHTLNPTRFDGKLENVVDTAYSCSKMVNFLSTMYPGLSSMVRSQTRTEDSSS